MYNKSMKWTFDNYLAYQLQGLSFLNGGKFTSMDVKRYFNSPTLLRRARQTKLTTLYKEQYNAWWNWDAFNDRIHRHLERVVLSTGGTRQKIRNKWVYTMSADGFAVGE